MEKNILFTEADIRNNHPGLVEQLQVIFQEDIFGQSQKASVPLFVNPSIELAYQQFKFFADVYNKERKVEDRRQESRRKDDLKKDNTLILPVKHKLKDKTLYLPNTTEILLYDSAPRMPNGAPIQIDWTSRRQELPCKIAYIQYFTEQGFLNQKQFSEQMRACWERKLEEWYGNGDKQGNISVLHIYPKEPVQNKPLSMTPSQYFERSLKE